MKTALRGAAIASALVLMAGSAAWAQTYNGGQAGYDSNQGAYTGYNGSWGNQGMRGDQDQYRQGAYNGSWGNQGMRGDQDQYRQGAYWLRHLWLRHQGLHGLGYVWRDCGREPGFGRRVRVLRIGCGGF
jgi:hypothetical protein